MKLAVIVLMGLTLLGSLVPLNAADAAGASQVVIGFTGGSTWTSASTGICVWYFPVIGDLDLGFLFAPDTSGAPIIDKQHAYLIWVSDWSIQVGFANAGFTNTGIKNVTLSLAVVPAGEGTIYFSNRPDTRDWSDLTKRSTWGIPVAKFVRGGGLFQSADSWASDKFFFSAPLVSSETFSLNGVEFNFRDLIPNGMTCFEYGQAASSSEVGSCTAVGSDRQGAGRNRN
jgi:hypothetical protein